MKTNDAGASLLGGAILILLGAIVAGWSYRLFMWSAGL